MDNPSPVHMIAVYPAEMPAEEQEAAAERLLSWGRVGGILVMPSNITLYQMIDGRMTRVIPSPHA